MSRLLKCSSMLFLALGMAFLAPSRARGLDNGVARTPPMGWNSWNKFACKGINEEVIRASADAIASNGMKDAGYQYVNMDDCWQISRDAAGNIVADPQKFPSGIKALADYVHSKGLKLGIYTDAGTKTCAGRPGSMGHEYQDAEQYAKWGIDYVKEDWCSTLPGQSSEASYTLMRDALAATGRPIVFSICEWGSTKPWLWAGPVGNSWRSTGDIQDCWDCKKPWGGNGLLRIIDQMDPLYSYAGPGHWNDPDMLEVGNGGMTNDEYRVHFSMWALFSAPLLAGNDLEHMTPEVREILLNKDVIAIDQDPMGIQGHRVQKSGDLEVWSKQLGDGGRAVVLLNRSAKPATIAADWRDIGYPPSLPAAVRDLWAHKDLAQHTGSFSAEVPSHGAVMVRIEP
ncbi:MAG TPA: glycoside hydrolase family 27 protein [Acidobacteriaceae bacterium]